MAKVSGSRNFLCIVGAAVLLAVAVLVFVVFVTPLFRGKSVTYGSYPDAYPSVDWMSRVPDATLLQSLTLPGTHDSASQYVKLAYFSKCQTRGIAEQLEAGYRYLDIRLAPAKSPEKQAAPKTETAESTQNKPAQSGTPELRTLRLMHGFADCKTGNSPAAPLLYLDSVLADCYRFLAANPTETIIFVAKKDHGDITTAEFQNLLAAYIAQAPERWFTENRIPTLGEARGKLVLARRHQNEAGLGNAGFGLVWAEQNNRADTYKSYAEEKQESGVTLFVQDRYKYDVKDKWPAFIEGLRHAEASRNGGVPQGSGAASQSGAGTPVAEQAPNAVHVSFLSTNGNTLYGHPIKYALPLNKKLWAQELERGHFYGWLILDYAAPELAQKIYMTNF